MNLLPNLCDAQNAAIHSENILRFFALKKRFKLQNVYAEKAKENRR